MVKEIELALKSKYEVSVLCCEFNNWSKNNNEKIKEQLIPQINYYGIQGNRTSFLPWIFSTLYFSFSKILLPIFPMNIFLLSVCNNKRSWLILRELKKVKQKIDLVVAHNPGSFYPAKQFAEKNKIPFGIDLEDYHPGETNDKKEAFYTKTLLNLILPNASYISAASPLILACTKADIDSSLINTEVVLNYFESSEFEIPENSTSKKLQLVWFSQNVGKGRGLEEIIPSICTNKNIELHLYGNINTDFYNKWIAGKENIFVYDALAQKDLHRELRKYDIGLAIENPSQNLNRDLCLTNKILAFYQAGLFILASDTKAQKIFIQENPDHGITISLEKHDLEIDFQKLLDNKNSLRRSALQRFEMGKGFTWKIESEKLVEIWKQIIN